MHLQRALIIHVWYPVPFYPNPTNWNKPSVHVREAISADKNPPSCLSLIFSIQNKYFILSQAFDFSDPLTCEIIRYVSPLQWRNQMCGWAYVLFIFTLKFEFLVRLIWFYSLSNGFCFNKIGIFWSIFIIYSNFLNIT